MRIAWFTPFSRGCKVARFSATVTREMARHADVDIWHPPSRPIRGEATNIRAVHKNSPVPELHELTPLRTIVMPRRVCLSPAMLEAYDLAVYNLGGEDGGRIAEAACAAPGIVILHGAAEAPVRRAYAVVARSEVTAESVLALAETVVAALPVLRCMDALACRLAEMGVAAGAPAVDRMAREACALFGGGLRADGDADSGLSAAGAR